MVSLDKLLGNMVGNKAWLVSYLMHPFLKILAFLILTRMVLLLIPWLLLGNNFSFWEFTENSWNRRDAPHYLYIAKSGYTNQGDEANFIVFMPLYPLLVKLASLVFKNIFWSAIILSLVFFCLGCFVLYEVVKKYFSEVVARRTIVFLATFPTSYFFMAPYSESLFFFTAALSFYSASRKDWLTAGVSAGLAAFTRPFGLLLAPSILFGWLMDKKGKSVHLAFTLLLPTLAAVVIYLYMNKIIYADYFAFQKILSSHWYKQFTLPPIGLYETWQRALSGELNYYTVMIGWAEALSLTFAWILLPIAFLKLPRSWAIYYLLSILLFSSTSFILSTLRYLLSIPPVFVLLAIITKRHLFQAIWLAMSISLLLYLTLLFAGGQWAF